MKDTGLLYLAVKEHKVVVLQTTVVRKYSSVGLQYELHALVSFKNVRWCDRLRLPDCEKVHYIEDGNPFHNIPDEQILVYNIDSRNFNLLRRATSAALPYKYKTMRSVFANKIESIFHDRIYWKCRAKHYRTYRIAGLICCYLRQDCYDDEELVDLVDLYCHDPRSFTSFLFSMHKSESQALTNLTEGPHYNALEDQLYLSDTMTDTDDDSDQN